MGRAANPDLPGQRNYPELEDSKGGGTDSGIFYRRGAIGPGSSCQGQTDLAH